MSLVPGVILEGMGRRFPYDGSGGTDRSDVQVEQSCR